MLLNHIKISQIKHCTLDNKENVHPTNFIAIMKYQQKDKSLIKSAKEKSDIFSIKKFHGAGKTSL